MEQIDTSSIITLPHSYPSVPSGIKPPVDPYAPQKRPPKAAWELFPIPSGSSSKASRLLALPLEIREHILLYALPYTLPCTTQRCKRNDQKGSDIVWQPGCISIMAASTQLHDECAKLLYSESVFDVSVWYSGIKFELKRLLPSGLMPKRDPKFEKVVSERYYHLIRRVRVTITIEDDYTGMIRYNCGGRGLPAGVQIQVKGLITILQKCASLARLQVEFFDYSAKKFSGDRNAELVLSPFFNLKNIKDASWSGAIPDDLVIRLMEATRPVGSRG